VVKYHETCVSTENAWKYVTCDRCGRTFMCTPSDDFYCVDGSPDHCCESCLVQPFTNKPVITCFVND